MSKQRDSYGNIDGYTDLLFDMTEEFLDFQTKQEIRFNNEIKYPSLRTGVITQPALEKTITPTKYYKNNRKAKILMQEPVIDYKKVLEQWEHESASNFGELGEHIGTTIQLLGDLISIDSITEENPACLQKWEKPYHATIRTLEQELKYFDPVNSKWPTYFKQALESAQAKVNNYYARTNEIESNKKLKD